MITPYHVEPGYIGLPGLPFSRKDEFKAVCGAGGYAWDAERKQWRVHIAAWDRFVAAFGRDIAPLSYDFFDFLGHAELPPAAVRPMRRRRAAGKAVQP